MPQPPKKRHCRATDDLTVEERVALEEAALKWMRDNNAGVKKAVKCPEFSVFTVGQLNGAAARAATRARTGNLSANAGNRLLTHEEEDELVEWIVEKNLKLDGPDTAQIGEKVLVILKARQVVLRALKSRRGQPLSTHAKAALKKRCVGGDFFRGLRERHGDHIKTGRSSNIDLKKAKKATFANAEKMLTKGSHSLYRELTELPGEDGKPLVGTTHPVTGKIIRPIIDPTTGEFTPYDGPGTSNGKSRLLQIDEAGQLMEYDGRALSKIWAGKGDEIKKPESVNRTSFSIMPCADCTGFLYCLQVLFAAAGQHDGLLPQAPDDDGMGLHDPDPHCWSFDNSKLSQNCLISATEKGMQTDLSLADRYALLKKELDARNVEMPVVIATDGHSSRTGPLTEAQTDAYGLRQWLAMSDTSGWAQMWDQLFKGFHAEYNRILKTWKIGEKRKNRQLVLNPDTVMQILAVMWGRAGPAWATPGMIMSAWTIVGVSATGLDPDLIPKDRLVGDRLAKDFSPTNNSRRCSEIGLSNAHESHLTVDEVQAFKLIDPDDFSKVATGDSLGHRKGSSAAYKLENIALREALRRLTALPVLPREMKILDVAGDYVPSAENKTRRRYTQVCYLTVLLALPSPSDYRLHFRYPIINGMSICFRAVRSGGA